MFDFEKSITFFLRQASQPYEINTKKTKLFEGIVFVLKIKGEQKNEKIQLVKSKVPFLRYNFDKDYKFMFSAKSSPFLNLPKYIEEMFIF